MEIQKLRTKGFPTFEEYKEFTQRWKQICENILKPEYYQSEKIFILYPDKNDSMIKTSIDDLNKEFIVKCLKTGAREDMENYIDVNIHLEPFIRAELNKLEQAYPDASPNSIINVAIHEMYERLGKEKSNKVTSN